MDCQHPPSSWTLQRKRRGWVCAPSSARHPKSPIEKPMNWRMRTRTRRHRNQRTSTRTTAGTARGTYGNKPHYAEPGVQTILKPHLRAFFVRSLVSLCACAVHCSGERWEWNGMEWVTAGACDLSPLCGRFSVVRVLLRGGDVVCARCR